MDCLISNSGTVEKIPMLIFKKIAMVRGANLGSSYGRNQPGWHSTISIKVGIGIFTDPDPDICSRWRSQDHLDEAMF